ncbi:hypothetical protein [Prescottella equi]|uniref:hypothetical protein n=1 Tax=Rhodococcus hoagii TaxID=43767 RepID=UPI000D0F814B|nr:hypothetical protein [Prescottella equi]AVP71253.1 hypothetical protein C7H75_24535 [Prescottella equi]
MLTSVPDSVDSPESSGDYAVTAMNFDSEYGWSIEVARPKEHFTDNTTFPSAAELSPEVRDALFRWLAAAGK